MGGLTRWSNRFLFLQRPKIIFPCKIPPAVFLHAKIESLVFIETEIWDGWVQWVKFNLWVKTKNCLITCSQGHYHDVQHDNDTTVDFHFNHCLPGKPYQFEELKISTFQFIRSSPLSKDGTGMKNAG